MFRNPQPTDETLRQHYANAYTEEKVRQGKTQEAGTSPYLARIYTEKLLRAIDYRTLAGCTVLEFGAGTGVMAAALQTAGARVIAVEPYAYEYCRGLGIETYRSLEEVPSGLTFDGIVTIDVIEHLRKPWLDLLTLRRFLRPGGWLYISTLNASGLNARLSRGRWREALKIDHFSFFSPEILERMFWEAGYINCKRLRWRVRYNRNPARALLNMVLQSTGLEGELRYVCYNPNT
jgi:SAM-dependent methyltransferase